ncbi:MAG: ArsA family ATPase, partial [Bradymonadaceae bacterium]
MNADRDAIPDARAAGSPLESILGEGRLVVCGGPGGVGKTTTAAALGLRASLMGRKVIVLTIDPAKRLANSLGLGELTNQPQQIELEALEPDDPGELWAMMLDQEKTFEELVRQAAPDEGALERSRDNEIFQLLSSALHGMQEYAALDKLHDLYTGGYFDLVVLDTPPTASAIDFLNAPERLARFFDRRILKWFLPESSRSTGFFGSLFDPGSVVLKLLSRLVGESFVEDLVEFFDTFQYLQETLQERGEMIEFIIRDKQTHFVLVTSAAPRRIREAIHFDDQLEEFDQRAHAFVVNKVTPDFATADLDQLSVADLQSFADRHA